MSQEERCQAAPPPAATPCAARIVPLAGLLTLSVLLLSRVSEYRRRMKLVSITLMLLGSLAFLGADTARLDTSSQFRKK